MAHTYLVTGAGRDIGAAIARRLARPGAFAILHYANSAAGAEDVLATIRKAGADGVTIRADLSRAEETSALAEALRHHLGDRALDALVLNAAATSPSPLGSVDATALESMLAVNVLAPTRLMDALHPRLADGAAVVAMSVAAVRQVFHPHFAAFAATKAAADALVRGWAVALGPRGIRVNSVAPGVVDANFRAELLKDDGFRQTLEAQTALGRAGRPDDIAEVVAFLASRESRWITGQVIDASGGWRL